MPRRLLVGLVALALTAPAATSQAAAGRELRRFPAYHRVQQGEWLWSIARHFMNRVYDDYDLRDGRPPTETAIANEVAQIKRLNKDDLDGDQVEPGQRLLLAPSIWDVPDGKPGWSTGFTWCKNETRPRHSRAPFRDMSLSAHLADPPLTSGATERAVLALTNDSDRSRRFDLSLERVLLVDRDGQPVGGVLYSDAIAVTQQAMDPHSRGRLVSRVRAKSCGDTRYLDRRVPPGRYRIVGVVEWRHGDRSGVWATPPRDVRVSES